MGFNDVARQVRLQQTTRAWQDFVDGVNQLVADMQAVKADLRRLETENRNLHEQIANLRQTSSDEQ
jgi:hypothetical protein